MISYNTDEIKMPVFPKRPVSKWIKQVATDYGKEIGSISIIFCSEKKILEINATYLNHNYYTDVITFDYSEEKKISADIYISPETVQTNALKYRQPYNIELYRVIIHAILHLCGINDKTPPQKSEMRIRENAALNLLSQPL